VRFILVDKILEMEPGKSIVASKTVHGTEDFLRDHFPGFPVIPGVLLTEMMAQAAGKCLDAERRARGKAMLARINSANFRSWVEPGQLAVIRADIKSNTDLYASAKCSIEVDGRIVCDADLFFSFVPTAKFAPDYVDEVLEAFLRRT
jgi:3-hydroxyacyl-[acyl-carrier-protein] dehydratase